MYSIYAQDNFSPIGVLPMIMKRSTPLKPIVFKLHAILTIQQNH